MRFPALVLVAVTAFVAAAEDQPKPGPFVTVYHDDAVSFQVRRDRIKDLSDGQYTVWLRWLYATPQPWKSDAETSRIAVTVIDCPNLRVRELAVLHKNREGKVFDEEEHPDTAEWRPLDRRTGAGAAVGRVCEWLPELLKAK